VRWFSIVAIFGLFWVIGAFFMLPFGIRTHDEEGLEKVPGQADSAPAHFRPGRVALRASIFALIVTALFVANYSFGWLTLKDLDWAAKPPHMDEVVKPG
jgi:predicted secreted protein